MNPSQNIFHYVIRVSKKDSAFVYFILESLEGVCFYSTLPDSLHATYRDIEIKGTPEYREELLEHLDRLKELFPITFCEQAS